jgi:hypothetical protein
MKARALVLAMGVVAAALGGSGDAPAAPADYPTDVLADYVFGCMAANGQSQDNLRRCSCSIDVIASIIPYNKYVQASTVLSLVQRPGESVAVFRDAAWTKGVVEDLRRAQAEADVRCF